MEMKIIIKSKQKMSHVFSECQMHYLGMLNERSTVLSSESFLQEAMTKSSHRKNDNIVFYQRGHARNKLEHDLN